MIALPFTMIKHDDQKSAVMAHEMCTYDRGVIIQSEVGISYEKRCSPSFREEEGVLRNGRSTDLSLYIQAGSKCWSI